MRILFITRKYPPSTGGMEMAAYRLYTTLATDNDVQLVKWGGSNKLLPVIYPWLLMQALWHGLIHKPDVIYLQDGIMAPLGWVVKSVLRRPTVMTIHGLEVTYRNTLYRRIVIPFMGRATRLVAVSNQTAQVVEQRLPGAHPDVIFNGLDDSFYDPLTRTAHLAAIARETGIPLESLQKRKLLYTNGRLVTRKGVLWFVQHVISRLPGEILYLVSGDGPNRERIEAAVTRLHLEDRVKILGRVPDEVRQALYNAVDIFVMPNIPVAGDMEGFGLVALEAASCGQMVLAAKLEGIQDAIIDGKNGRLVAPRDTAAWVQAITRELKARSIPAESARRFALEHYSWKRTASAYEAIMQEAAKLP